MMTAGVLQNVQATLLADATLTAWCVAQFGVAPTVWIGVDEQSPPDHADYPLVSIVGIEQMRGGARNQTDWRLQIGVGVINENLSSSGYSRIYTGMLQVETLREHTEDAIYRAKIPGLTVGIDTNGESATSGHHPLYLSYTSLVVSSLKTTRRGLPG